MIDPVTLVQNGGAMQYVVLVLALLALPFNGILALLSARVRIPPAAHLILPAATAGAGVLGTYLGLVMAGMAIENASPEFVPILAANGLAIANYTSLLSAIMCSLTLAVSTGLTGLMLAVRWKTTDGAEPKEAMTRTELLGGIGLLASTGVATLGWALWLNSDIDYWSAAAKASDETKAALMASAIQSGNTILLVSMLLMGLFILLGLGAVAARRATLPTSSWISLGLAALLSFTITSGFSLAVMSQSDVKANAYTIGDGKLPGMPSAPN